MAQAVEAGEVSADLRADLQAELDAVRERPQEEGHAAAIQHLAAIAEVPEEEAAKILAAMEAQSTMTRAVLLHRIAEAWPEWQRDGYRNDQAW